MRIFALQTNIDQVKKRFLNDEEHIVYMTYYHGLSFLFAIVREIFITFVLLGIGVTGWYFGWPMLWTVGILSVIWLVFVFFNILRAWIDWFFDYILITTDKIILVDQTSIFRKEIHPIQVENIGGITTGTQFWDIFPFGSLTIHLKEGLGGDMIPLKYVPHAQEVASTLSDVVTRYMRHHFDPKEHWNLEQGPAQGGDLSGGQKIG